MRAGGEVDGISRCADEVDSHFVSLVRRLEEDKSLLKDQEKAAEAAAALRNALQARLSHHANNGTGKDQRDEMSKKRDAIASSFLNASPSLNILDLFDAYAKDGGNSMGKVCIPILVIVSRLLTCMQSPRLSKTNFDWDKHTTGEFMDIQRGKLETIALSMIQASRIRMYYSFLSSGLRARANAVLLLLSSIVRRGGRFPREVLNRLDWNLNALGRIAKPMVSNTSAVYKPSNEAPSRKESKLNKPTRYALQELTIAFLRCRDESVVRTIVSQEAPVQLLLKHISDDPNHEGVINLLGAIQQVTHNNSIPARLLSTIFGDSALNQLQKMCEHLDTSSSFNIENNHISVLKRDPSSKDVATLALRLLFRLICIDLQNKMHSFTHDEIEQQTASEIDGNNIYNKKLRRVTKFCVSLHLLTSSAHQLLVMKVISKFPGFGLMMLEKLNLSLEPNQSEKWENSIELYIKIATTAKDALFGKNGEEDNRSGARSQVCRIIKSFSRALFSRGLLHASPLIKYRTLQLVETVIHCIILPCTKTPKVSNVEHNDNFVLSECTPILPDPQTLISVASGSLKYLQKSSVEQSESKSTDVDSNAEKRSSSIIIALKALSLLRDYCKHFPKLMANLTSNFEATNFISSVVKHDMRGTLTQLNLPLIVIRGLLQLQNSHHRFLAEYRSEYSYKASVSTIDALLTLVSELHTVDDRLEPSLQSLAFNACYQTLNRCETFLMMGAPEINTTSSWSWLACIDAFNWNDFTNRNCIIRFFSEAVVSSSKSTISDGEKFLSLIQRLNAEEISNESISKYISLEHYSYCHFMFHIINRCFKVMQSKVMSDSEKLGISMFVSCGIKLVLMTSHSYLECHIISKALLMQIRDFSETINGTTSNEKTRSVENCEANGECSSTSGKIIIDILSHVLRQFDVNRIDKVAGPKLHDDPLKSTTVQSLSQMTRKSQGFLSICSFILTRDREKATAEIESFSKGMRPECIALCLIGSKSASCSKGAVDLTCKKLMVPGHFYVPFTHMLLSQYASSSSIQNDFECFNIIAILQSICEYTVGDNDTNEMITGMILKNDNIFRNAFTPTRNMNVEYNDMTRLLERFLMRVLEKNLHGSNNNRSEQSHRDTVFRYIESTSYYVCDLLGARGKRSVSSQEVDCHADSLRMFQYFTLTKQLHILETLKNVACDASHILEEDNNFSIIWRRTALTTLKSILCRSICKESTHRDPSSVIVEMQSQNVRECLIDVLPFIATKLFEIYGIDDHLEKYGEEVESLTDTLYHYIFLPRMKKEGNSLAFDDTAHAKGCDFIDPVALCSSLFWKDFLTRTISCRRTQKTSRLSTISKMSLVAELITVSIIRWNEAGRCIVMNLLGMKTGSHLRPITVTFDFHSFMRMSSVLRAYLMIAVKVDDHKQVYAHRESDAVGDALIISVASINCYAKYLWKKCSINMNQTQHACVKSIVEDSVQILLNRSIGKEASSALNVLHKSLQKFSSKRKHEDEGNTCTWYDAATMDIISSMMITFDEVLSSQADTSSKTFHSIDAKLRFSYLYQTLLSFYTVFLKTSVSIEDNSEKRPQTSDIVSSHLLSCLSTFRHILMRMHRLLSSNTTLQDCVMQEELVKVTANLIAIVLDKHIEDSRMMMELSNLVCCCIRMFGVDSMFGSGPLFKVVTAIFDNLVSDSRLSKVVLQSSKIAIHATLNHAHNQFHSTSSIIDCEATTRSQKVKLELTEDSNNNDYITITICICRIFRSIMEIIMSHVANIRKGSDKKIENSVRWFEERDVGSFYKLLMCGYQASLSLKDRELLKTIQMLQTFERKQQNADEGDEEAKKSTLLMTGSLWEGAADRARDQFKNSGLHSRLLSDDNVIDFRRSALSVLYFPSQGKRESNHQTNPNSDENGIDGGNILPVVSEHVECLAYDPDFMLPFTLNALRTAGMTPFQVSSQGLLAIALMSLCSAEQDVRTIGYAIVAEYAQQAKSHDYKEKSQLIQLIDGLSTSVQEEGERLPAFLCTFCAEASVLLHHRQKSDLYPYICKLLQRGASLSKTTIPLYSKLMGSGGTEHRAHRIWVLKVLSVGVRHANHIDESILRRAFIPELLMSAWCSSMYDAHTKKHILYTLTDVAKLPFNSVDLVHHAGMVQWFANSITSIIQYNLNARTTTNSNVDKTCEMCVGGLISLIGNVGNPDSTAVGLKAIRQICCSIESLLRIHRSRVTYVQEISRVILALKDGNKTRFQHSWDKHCLSTLHVFMKIVDDCCFSTRQTAASNNFLGAFDVCESILLLLPNSSCERSMLQRCSGYEYEVWCHALEWCIHMTLPLLDWHISCDAKGNDITVDDERATGICLDIIKSLSMFARIGHSFSFVGQGKIDNLQRNRETSLALAVMRIYRLMPTCTQRECMEDMLLAQVSILPAVQNLATSQQQDDMNQYIDKLLRLYPYRLSNDDEMNVDHHHMELILTMFRLQYSNAPKQLLDSVLAEAKSDEKESTFPSRKRMRCADTDDDIL